MKAGDKIVCIEGSAWGDLQSGEVYTIKSKAMSGSGNEWMLTLEEFYTKEVWRASRFVPIDSPEGVQALLRKSIIL